MTTSNAKIAILMGTMNGAPYLAEQLDSFMAQDHTHWTLYASDDGSTDDTLAILRDYQSRWGEDRLVILSGPRKGFAANFMAMLYNQEIQADYYAYADQDDIWLPHKLSHALAHLPSPDKPGLYCSASLLVDGNNQEIGPSYIYKKPPAFGNALCENIAGGNTMVFTHAACNILRLTGTQRVIPYHDWWTYIAIAAAGGSLYYDREPTIRYRQHGHNLIGSSSNLGLRIKRIMKQYGGGMRYWNDCHLAALADLEAVMPPQTRQTFHRFAETRHKSLFPRIFGLQSAALYRQTVPGTVSLMLATLLKRM